VGRIVTQVRSGQGAPVTAPGGSRAPLQVLAELHLPELGPGSPREAVGPVRRLRAFPLRPLTHSAPLVFVPFG